MTEDLAVAMDTFLGEAERVLRPTVETALVDRWLPAVGGPVARLSYGGQVADVGCGRGDLAVVLARRFPLASVHGFDTDPASIEEAKAAAQRAGVEVRCRFARCAAGEVPAGSYDLLLLVGLHDLPDPLGAARRARKVVARDGVVVVVGPVADTPGLGVAPGPAATTQLLRRAGFGEITVVAATPFLHVLAAHPPR